MTEDRQDWNDMTNESIKERRGTFLNVLCILSWVWIGFMVLSTLFTYMGGTEKIEESLYLIEESSASMSSNSNAWAEMMIGDSIEISKRTLANFTTLNFVTIIMYLIGGFSVFLMFQLKKTGYFIYVFYSLALPSIGLYFLGTDLSIVLASALFGYVISIAFIIMYGVNLKRMTA